ncbi:MAG: hypothetical protein K2X77_04445 [Candidatus Obscuribacterales bacterium]|nr:hypothetical protein [Candidatus Obscuribacterales bacterium]
MTGSKSNEGQRDKKSRKPLPKLKKLKTTTQQDASLGGAGYNPDPPPDNNNQSAFCPPKTPAPPTLWRC